MKKKERRVWKVIDQPFYNRLYIILYWFDISLSYSTILFIEEEKTIRPHFKKLSKRE